MTSRILTKEEVAALSARIKKGDLDARNELVMANVRLVVAVAKLFRTRGMALDDLVGEGNIGLIRAAEKYDPRFGTVFSTYAYFWIKQAILDSLWRSETIVRLPEKVYRAMGKALSEINSGDHSDLGCIIQKSGLPDCMKNRLFQARRTKKIGPLPDLIHGNWGADAESEVECRDEFEKAVSEIGSLTGTMRDVMQLRHGLNGKEPMGLTAISRRLGYSREWCRKMENKAVAILRDRLAS